MSRSQFPATQHLTQDLDGLIPPVVNDGKCLDQLPNLSCLSLIPLPEVLDVGIEVRGPGVEVPPERLNDKIVVTSQELCLVRVGQMLDLCKSRAGAPWADTRQRTPLVEHFVAADAYPFEIHGMKIVLVLGHLPPSGCVDGEPVEQVPGKIRCQGDAAEIRDAEQMNLPDSHFVKFQEEQGYARRVEVPGRKTQSVVLQAGKMPFEIAELIQVVTLYWDEELSVRT